MAFLTEVDLVCQSLSMILCHYAMTDSTYHLPQHIMSCDISCYSKPINFEMQLT